MAILNPKYAFLEVDFQNPNLTQVERKVENISEKIQKTPELIGNSKIAFKIILAAIYIKLNWMVGWLIRIPVDIYCAAPLVNAELFS